MAHRCLGNPLSTTEYVTQIIGTNSFYDLHLEWPHKPVLSARCFAPHGAFGALTFGNGDGYWCLIWGLCTRWPLPLNHFLLIISGQPLPLNDFRLTQPLLHRHHTDIRQSVIDFPVQTLTSSLLQLVLPEKYKTSPFVNKFFMTKIRSLFLWLKFSTELSTP